MKQNLTNKELEIKNNLLNLMKISSSAMQKHSPKSLVGLEFSGLVHDIRYHMELVDHFYPLDIFLKKFLIEHNPNKDVAEIFVSRADRNIRKSLITMILFTLETIIKIIAKHHEIIIPENSTVGKYIRVMKYFDIYSKENKDLVNILHYTRNTLHNGERVDKESHQSYMGTTYDFVKGQDIKSTDWTHLTFLIQQLLYIFKQIIESPKYTLK
jgi:hypothetical protein